jgi:hypothetical protein
MLAPGGLMHLLSGKKGFRVDSMLELLFGHPDNALGAPRDDIIISGKNGGVRQRTRKLLTDKAYLARILRVAISRTALLAYVIWKVARDSFVLL